MPYGSENANQNMSLLVEEGFKQVRGLLTEGRFLIFEMFGFALTNVNSRFVAISHATEKHDNINQRWIIHPVNGPGSGKEFYIQSAADNRYIAAYPNLGGLTTDVKKAQSFTITYSPNGAEYSISVKGGSDSYVKFKPNNSRRSLQEKRASADVSASSSASISWAGGFGGFKIYSVSYKE